MKTRPGLKIHDRSRMAFKSDGTKLPVIDSPLTTIIQPNEEDIKNGVRGDHANCMYCLACRRMFNSELVWVTRTLAYVELRGRGGRAELHRFILKDPAKAQVKDFDAGYITPEAVIFASPKGTQSLDAKTDAWHKWNERRKREKTKKKAYVKGTGVKPGRKGPPKYFSETLRDPATGMFQFATRHGIQ